jgi:Ca2+-binding RTX toxin-like protein
VVDANIYVKDATVVGPGEALDTDPGNDISPDWQPDSPTCDIRGTNGDDNGVANDALNGTSADEVICGRGGNDVINGGGGNDILMGEGGNDTLIAPSGKATLNGGTGKDTASFAGARRPVDASLVSGFALRLGTDPLEGVALVGVENLTGTRRNDVLEGSNGPNKLVAAAGADRLFGLGGNDNLNSRDGVSGNDRVDGGADTDTCTTDGDEAGKNCER